MADEIRRSRRRHAVPRHDDAEEGDLPRPSTATGSASRCMHGVGGSFDVLAGVTRRAPRALAAARAWSGPTGCSRSRAGCARRYLVTNLAFVGLLLRRAVHRHPGYTAPAARLAVPVPDPARPGRTIGIGRTSSMTDYIFDGRVAVLGLGYIGLPPRRRWPPAASRSSGSTSTRDTVEAIVARARCRSSSPTWPSRSAARSRWAGSRATTEVPDADAYIIAVPTPFNDDHTADLSYVRAAAEPIAPQLRGGEVVILESTSPAGHHRAGQPVAGRAAARPRAAAQLRGRSPTSTSRTARSACCPAGS